MSARDMILKQVEDTHHLIRNSKSVLEAERRIPGNIGRKAVSHARSAIGHWPLRRCRQCSWSLFGQLLESINLDRTIYHQNSSKYSSPKRPRNIDGSSNDSEVERFNLGTSAKSKIPALEKLMKQIQDLVGQSGTLLGKIPIGPERGWRFS